MARTINVGGKEYSREDAYFLPPEEVIAQREANVQSRFDKDGLRHNRVIELAKSFLDEGQQQPCAVRAVGDKRVALISGRHRHAAALLCKHGDAKLGIEPHPDWKLHVILLKDVNDQDAYIGGVIENELRAETTHMDRAVTLKQLRIYGKTDEQIAKLLNRGKYNGKGEFVADLQYIRKLESLNSLPYNIQTRVHSGEIALHFAVTLAGYSEEERKAVLSEAAKQAQQSLDAGNLDAQIGSTNLGIDPGLFTPPNGDGTTPTVPAAVNTHLTHQEAVARDAVTKETAPLTADAIRKAIRKSAAAKGKTTGTGRSFKEVKDYFLNLAAPTEEGPVFSFANNLLDFFEGRIEPEDLDKALSAFRQDKSWKKRNTDGPSKSRLKRVAAKTSKVVNKGKKAKVGAK